MYVFFHPSFLLSPFLVARTLLSRFSLELAMMIHFKTPSLYCAWECMQAGDSFAGLASDTYFNLLSEPNASNGDNLVTPIHDF